MAIILDDDEVTFDDVCGNVAIEGRAVEGNCGHEPINRQRHKQEETSIKQQNISLFLFYLWSRSS